MCQHQNNISMWKDAWVGAKINIIVSASKNACKATRFEATFSRNAPVDEEKFMPKFHSL